VIAGGFGGVSANIIRAQPKWSINYFFKLIPLLIRTIYMQNNGKKAICPCQTADRFCVASIQLYLVTRVQ
jgi:hypothetical protein